jgi:hypothetical protein
MLLQISTLHALTVKVNEGKYSREVVITKKSQLIKVISMHLINVFLHDCHNMGKGHTYVYTNLILFLKRLPEVGGEPGSSQFYLFSHNLILLLQSAAMK